MKKNKDMEKVADLEFEWKVAILTKQDEDVIKLAKLKFIKEYNKLFKVSKTASNEQKRKNSINI